MIRFIPLLLLVGCASNPPPTLDFSDLQPIEVQATEPVVLPSLPVVTVQPRNGEEGVWISSEGFNALERFRVVAEGNSEIAQNNADALNAHADEINALIQMGQLQGKILKYREEQLEYERQEHAKTKWFYRILTGLGAVLGLSAGLN